MNWYIFGLVAFSIGFLVGVGALFYTYRLSRLSEEEFTASFERSGQILAGPHYKLDIPPLLRKLIIGVFILISLGVITISGAGIYNMILFLTTK